MVIIQSACSSLPPPMPRMDYRVGDKLVIVASDQPPEIALEGFPQNKGTGALSTAGEAFGACVAAPGSGYGGCTGSMCGAALVLWLGICSVAGVVGGVVGAVSTPSAATTQSAQSTVSETVNPTAAQEALRQQVISAAMLKGGMLVDMPAEKIRALKQGGNHQALAAAGIDEVLEVSLVKVGIEGSDAGKALWGTMKARARLINAHDGSEHFSTDFLFSGPQLLLAEWMANDGERLLSMLRTGYETLGPQIYDDVFLRYPFPDQHSHSPSFFFAYFGLAPIYPIRDSFDGAFVDSLQPTLRWSGFPRDSDVAVDPEKMARVRNVRYDLIVADAEYAEPGTLIYRREGLSGTQHRMSVPLQWGREYRWTVRARFEIDGEERVTEWSRSWFPGKLGGVPPAQVSPPTRLAHPFRIR